MADTEPPSLADIAERLFAQFERQLDLTIVIATVRHCRRELELANGASDPESVERLARARLDSQVARARRSSVLQQR